MKEKTEHRGLNGGGQTWVRKSVVEVDREREECRRSLGFLGHKVGERKERGWKK